MNVEELRQYKEMLEPYKKVKEYVVLSLGDDGAIMYDETYTLSEIEENYDTDKTVYVVEDEFKKMIEKAPNNLFYNSLELMYTPCIFCEKNVAKEIVDRTKKIYEEKHDFKKERNEDLIKEWLKDLNEYMDENISNKNILLDYIPFIINGINYFQWFVYDENNKLVMPDNNIYYDENDYDLKEIIDSGECNNKNVYVINHADFIKKLKDDGCTFTYEGIMDNNNYINNFIKCYCDDGGDEYLQIIADFRKIKPKEENKQL